MREKGTNAAIPAPDDGNDDDDDDDDSNVDDDQFLDEIINGDDEEALSADLVVSDGTNTNSDSGTKRSRAIRDGSRTTTRNDNKNRESRPSRLHQCQCWGVGIAIVLAFFLGVAVSAFLLKGNNGGYNRYRTGSASGENQRSPSISSNSPAHSRPGDITSSIARGSTANNHFTPSPPSGVASNNHAAPNTLNNNYHNSGGLSHSAAAAATAVDTESRIEREHHFTNLVIEWSGGVALATKNFPARMALDWILDDDTFRLTTSDKALDVQQRYTAAVFYFATRGERWSSSRNRNRNRRERKIRRQRQLQQQSLHDDFYNAPHGSTHASSGNSAPAHFLTNRDVCLWKTSDGKSGIFCNDEGIIVKLTFRKSIYCI